MTPSRDHGTRIYVRLAQTDREIEAAQRLRYRVFYEEYGAHPSPEAARDRIDKDEFDAVADHLIVIDPARGEGDDAIVGTYRMLRQDVAERHGTFYTSSEFDISLLKSSGANMLELGRSCVLDGYRTRPVMQLLWQGIADYVAEHNVQVMFGCASLHGTDVDSLGEQLAYLYHYHLAPEHLRPRALADRYVAMDRMPIEKLHKTASFNALPALLKGYLRVGAWIGDGAVIDEQFNTVDVCIVVPTHLVTSRYRRHYERTTGRPIPSVAPESFLQTSEAPGA